MRLGKRDIPMTFDETYTQKLASTQELLVALVLATSSHCLRGARDPTARMSTATWESGGGFLSIANLTLLVRIAKLVLPDEPRATD